MKKSKNYWSLAGLFIIVLVLTTPFYSVNALAGMNVQITKNSGEKGLWGYLDANGDVWTVETIIEGVDEGVAVDPKNVKLKIGTKETPFKTCSSSAMGATCEYISPLTDGVKEAEYAFQVIYETTDALGYPITPAPSNGDVIRADGSGPKITNILAVQNKDGGVDIDFTVNDKIKEGAPSIGIKLIEILDADTGSVIQTITDFEQGVTEYDYANDGNFGGKLQYQFTGEGFKKIKIRAVDFLEHVTLSPVIPFAGDFVKPEIQDNLNFTTLGKFIGEFNLITDLTVDVIDSNDLLVKASSASAGLDGTEAECEADKELDNLWHCRWKNIEVKPESSISVTITATDDYGNKAEKSFTSSFTKDITAPVVEFFGSERVFEGKSYLLSGKQRIILQGKESGVGINEQGLRADLESLGLGFSEAPVSCDFTISPFECYWDTSKTFASSGVASIGLEKYADLVGNEKDLPTTELIIDTSAPKVKSLAFYGEEKDYFQSNDRLKIKMTVEEIAGLNVLINLNKVVMDAETKLPENMHTRDFSTTTGWQVFTEKDCERKEGAWECEFLTEAIKSGPDDVEFEIKVQDTAGNNALEWPEKVKNVDSFSPEDDGALLGLEILGLSLENNPDYWEVQKVVALGGESAFIDLDTTPLTYARMPFEIRLGTASGKVKAVDVNLIDCLPEEALKAGAAAASSAPSTAPAASPSPATGSAAATSEAAAEESLESPVVSRSLLYNGVSADGDQAPKPKIVIEFEPFDGRELFNLKKIGGEDFTKKYVDYVCRIQIYSKVEDTAIGTAEMQEISVSVPFGFSSLGSQDENLKEIIQEARDEAGTGFWGVIGTLQSVLKWLNYISQIIQTILSTINIVLIAQAGIEPAYQTPAKGGAIAGCFGLSNAAVDASETVKFLSYPVNILSCNDEGMGMKGLKEWREGILSVYNIEIGKSPDSPIGAQEFRPARSIKDNLYLSIAGVCVPGIIQNLDKYRQVKCRKVVCLEQEVKAGLATVSQCEELEDLLTCKYFLGELWYIFPFSQFYDAIINALWHIMKDPIALARNAILIGCGIDCVVSSKLASGCAYAYYIIDIVDWIESIVSFIVTISEEFENGGLQYCDSVGL